MDNKVISNLTLDEIFAEVDALSTSTHDTHERQPGEFTINEYAMHRHILWCSARKQLERLEADGKMEQAGYIRHPVNNVPTRVYRLCAKP